MSRSSLLILLGILVFLAPFSGLPMSLLIWILPVLGLSIGLIGVSLRPRPVARTHDAREPQTA